MLLVISLVERNTVTQNIYDDEEFFEGYSQLPRSMGGLSEAPEWPTVRSLLPDLRDARILDLGCGFGVFDRWAIEQGADSVVAVDLSEKMLARARELTSTDKIQYVNGDLSELDHFPRTFDLIYSALAFHYVSDFTKLCCSMRERLRDGGRLVATIEHPIYTAPSRPEWINLPGDGVIWPLDSYFLEGKRTTNWITEGVVKHHRTVGNYVQSLLQNGFMLLNFVEWVPDTQQLSEHPEWANEVNQPMFLIFSADAT